MVPVYCITLDPKGQRAQRTVDEFRPYGITPTLFRGIDGKKAALKATVELHHDLGEPYFIGPHHIGIILSHLMLWNHLVTAKVPEALIVEDDVKLCKNFADEFSSSYSELPNDWGYALVGHCCAVGRSSQQITKRVWHVQWPMCTHCYLVKLSALEVMFESMVEFRAPLDIAIIDNVFAKGIAKCYTFLPRQAEQYDTCIPY